MKNWNSYFILVAENNTQKSWTNWQTLIFYTTPYQWKAKLTANVSVMNQIWVSVYLNNTKLEKWWTWYAQDLSKSIEMDVNKWDTIELRADWSSWNYTATHKNSKLRMSPQSSWNILRPIFLKEIWQIISCTLYWNHIDWKYYGWIMIEETTTAYTGQISPWNFVWYIRVNFNWKMVRIPYYDDERITDD